MHSDVALLQCKSVEKSIENETFKVLKENVIWESEHWLRIKDTFFSKSLIGQLSGSAGSATIMIIRTMGSSIRMTDFNSSTMELYGYDEFGRDLIHNENYINPFGFTNYQRDDVCGMYYAQARQYYPNICRFVSRDFVKGRIDSSLSQNEYIY